jgi:hypothetical protein
MAAGIKEIRQRAADLLETAVPDVDSWIKYREIQGYRDITEMEHTSQAAQTTRQFQVLAIPIDEEGFLGGCSVDQQQRLRITLRYYTQPTTSRGESSFDYQSTWDRIGSDSARILEVLERPPVEGNWDGTPLRDIRFVSSTEPFTSDVANMVYVALDFEVLYRLDQQQGSGVITRAFGTLTEVREYLDGKEAGTVARLQNLRTKEAIGLWIQLTDGTAKLIGDCDFTKADGTEFDISATGDIRPRGVGTASITYGTGLVVATEGAQFWGAREKTDRDFLHVGTHTNYTVPVEPYLGEFFAVGDLPSPANTDDVAYVVDESTGAISDLYRYDGAVWNACGGGGGTIGEHTTLADLFAQTPTAGDRRAVVRSGAVVGEWIGDGTRWRLNGEIDFTASGTATATIFAGYISTDNIASTTYSDTLGVGIVEGGAQLRGFWFLQTLSSPMQLDASQLSLQVGATWSLSARTNTSRWSAMAGLYIERDSDAVVFIMVGADDRVGPTMTQARAQALYGQTSALSAATGGTDSGCDSLSGTVNAQVGCGATGALEALFDSGTAGAQYAVDAMALADIGLPGKVKGIAIGTRDDAGSPHTTWFSSVRMGVGT